MRRVICYLHFFFLPALPVTKTCDKWQRSATHIHSGDLADDFSDLCLIAQRWHRRRRHDVVLWCVKQKVFSVTRIWQRAGQKTQTFLPLPPLLLPLSFLIICATTSCHSVRGPMRFVTVCPICCVYDSFVYSLVHIRAYCNQGDSLGAGLGPGSEVSLAQWFITFLTK